MNMFSFPAREITDVELVYNTETDLWPVAAGAKYFGGGASKLTIGIHASGALYVD